MAPGLLSDDPVHEVMPDLGRADCDAGGNEEGNDEEQTPSVRRVETSAGDEVVDGAYEKESEEHAEEHDGAIEGLFAPQWSSDGFHASAMALDGQRIRLFDFKTRTWSDLVNGWGLVRWSGDSQYLYYLRYGKDSAVMRVHVGDRKVEELASLSGARLTGRLAGLDFGLTPDGAPLVLRDIGTQEIYSLDWRAQ